MKQRIKSIIGIGSVGLAIIAGTVMESSAQTRREIERDRQRYEQRQEAIARQNARRERERRQRMRDERRSDDRYDNNGYYNEGDPYYRGSVRGAVNATVLQGYQVGLSAGQADAQKRKYNRSNVYRNTGSAPNNGDPTSWDYLYRQGYLEGYDDGYYGRRRY